MRPGFPTVLLTPDSGGYEEEEEEDAEVETETEEEGGEEIEGYLQKVIQTPMAQGRSTTIISMIMWIRTSKLPIQNSLSLATNTKSQH